MTFKLMGYQDGKSTICQLFYSRIFLLSNFLILATSMKPRTTCWSMLFVGFIRFYNLWCLAEVNSVLRSLVKNPDGLFWAGDTAQTISVGSSFRFNDLKAFLFRLEVHMHSSPNTQIINLMELSTETQKATSTWKRQRLDFQAGSTSYIPISS